MNNPRDTSLEDRRPSDAILGFDETFLAPFARRPIEATTTRATYRMTIVHEMRGTQRNGWSSTSPVRAKPLWRVLQAFDNAITHQRATTGDGDEETLFQLPRTDSAF